MMFLLPFIVESSILFLQTGSPFLQDYEWYTFEAAGNRLFNGKLDLPLNKTARCIFGDLPPLRWMEEDDDALSDIKDGKLIRVHITLKEVRRAGAAVQNSGYHLFKDKRLREKTTFETEGALTPLPYDDATLFPYLWDGILRDGEFMQSEPYRRYFFSSNIEFIVRPDWANLTDPKTVKNVLLAGDNADDVADFIRLELKRPAAMVSLSTETCFTVRGWIRPEVIPFGVLTYGDCAVIDDKRYLLWPLGPKVSAGFPARLSYIAPMKERKCVVIPTLSPKPRAPLIILFAQILT